MDVNHYEVLGVPSTADQAAIRRAYRRLARLTHPDLGGDAAEFAAVALAWSVLSDPEARAAHDAELARDGDDDWGEEVGLEEPMPAPTRAAQPDPLAPQTADEPPAAGDGEAHPAAGPVDPFTSPPRTLPLPDTSGIVRHYPRPVGGWAFLGYAAAVVVAIGLVIAFADHMPVSPGAFVGLLAYSCVLVGALALRALPGGSRVGALSATLLYGTVGGFVLAGATWLAEDHDDDASVARAVVVVVGVLASLAAAGLVEARRARTGRVVRELRRVHDAANAARRWNLLLHALQRAPGGTVVAMEVTPVGRRRREPGWAVVDESGDVHATASDADRLAWGAALRAAGIDVV